MSIKHPIIAVTGSSGAGTSTVEHIFQNIFRRENIKAAYVHGNGFRRFKPDEISTVFKQAADAGRPISHFGPEANLLDRLEGLFREYSRTGTGCIRRFIENEEQAERLQQPIGTYTPWEDIPMGTDLLIYEGSHGACIEATWTKRHLSPSHNPLIVNERHKLQKHEDVGIDIAQWADLLIGVVPSINLEWIQKIDRDCSKTGCSLESVTRTILRRMPDYVRYITPQFSFTDINFQRVPLVDTSNPFVARDVPTQSESMTVIRFREPNKFEFPPLLRQIHNSFMSRPNTLVIPSSELEFAMELICTPLVRKLVQRVKEGGTEDIRAPR